FDGCWGDDQDRLDIANAGEDFGGGEGLHGFAEAHVVAEDRPATTGGENRAAELIVVERNLEQIAQDLGRAAGVELGQPFALALEHGSQFESAIDEVVRLRVNRDLFRDAPSRLLECGELVAGFPQSAVVEELPGQLG